MPEINVPNMSFSLFSRRTEVAGWDKTFHDGM